MNSRSPRCFAALLLLVVAMVAVTGSSADAANTVVKYVVHAGPLDPTDPNDPNVRTFYLRMAYGDAHDTVANYLNYVNNGVYNDSIFHRLHLEGGLEVLQGGGVGYDGSNGGYYYLPTDAPIADDYDRPNVRGTIAMAKSSAPNSATSQFYFNLKDVNATTLGPHNSGGFMVFAYVIGDGMDAVDDLAGYSPNPLGVEINPLNYSGVLAEIPLIPNGESLYFEWLSSVSVHDVDGDADFDGDVDGDDYSAFLASFGQRGVGLAADFDGDYDVDLADFAVLRANYTGPSSSPLPAPGASVPEPASICLLGLGAAAMIRKRRRKA